MKPTLQNWHQTALYQWKPKQIKEGQGGEAIAAGEGPAENEGMENESEEGNQSWSSVLS